jgi:hypothetical protein
MPAAAHAAALGDQLQVPVALGRRGLCRGAWHRARTWRHNDRRIGMMLADLTVDIVPIVRSIAGKRHNRSRDLLKQPPSKLLEPGHNLQVFHRRGSHEIEIRQ